MQSLYRLARTVAPPAALPSGVRHATKKAKGASKNGRKTIGRRLGPKVMDGEYVETGNVLVRQRGTRMFPGLDVGCGRDHTLYSLSPGLVRFARSRPDEGKRRGRVFVRVDPIPEHRGPSVQRKIRRLAMQRYQGPILHAPR